MEFNADEFRKKAKAAGLSDEDIESEVSYQTGGKSSPFEKDAGGFKIGTQDDLKERVGNDWWHLPAAAIGGAGLGFAGKAAYDWYKSKNQPAEMTRIEPTLVEPAAPAAPEAKPMSPMETLQARKEQILSGLQQNAPQGSVPPAAPVAAAPAPVQPPVAPVPAAPSTPAIADAVAAGESPAKAIQIGRAHV